MFKKARYTSIGKNVSQAGYIAHKKLSNKKAIVAEANEQLLTICEAGEKETILEELLSNSSSDNFALDADGNNTLMKLLKERSSDFILFLLAGLSKNSRLTPYLLFVNKNHETFLVLAAKKGYTDVCKKVLRFMNENIYDFSGKLVGEKSYENQCYLAFLAASKFGHYEVIEFFLSKVDLELLLKDKCSGDTALTVACRENHTRVATLLYEHGADPEEENKIGESPYLLACAHRNVDLIVLFSDCQELAREEIREVVSNIVNKSNNSDDQVCFKSLSFERYCKYLYNKRINALKFEDYIEEFPRRAKKFYESNRSNEASENKRQFMYGAFKHIQKSISSLEEKLDHLVDPLKHSFCLLWGDELLDSLKGELEKILNLNSMIEIYKLFIFSDDYKPRLLFQIKNITEQLSELEKVSSSNASSEASDNGNLLFHQKRASRKRARPERAPVVPK